MSNGKRRFALVLGTLVLALIIAGAYIVFSSPFLSGGKPSTIAHFTPVSFEARAASPFFYSIGNDLKYSDEIDPRAPTLVSGFIKDYLVAPNGQLIAVVVNGALVIVDSEKHAVRTITKVDSIYREPKPIGTPFYRDDNFQWSRDSRALYIIKDEFYESKGSQLFSSKGELWRYDLETGHLQLVLKSFPAYTYFFGREPGVYFSVPTEKGDLHLQYFDGINVNDVEGSFAATIPVRSLQKTFLESPFFSFSIFAYQDHELRSHQAALVSAQSDPNQDFRIGSKTYVSFTRGEGLKGEYYCSELLRSVFLPGNRYFLLNTPYCENFNGQLLIDTESGKYKTLPSDTRVYVTLNTNANPDYRITAGGMAYE
ncbi:hypothetical protein FTW19_20825 [Terriglobus albidus]|uniref:Uncharacterized protein n=1 Tax=Terriglobus albidus TaxID=1592106 RepID=A0A5B9EET0_9BACT|nr:hypothetical protein [Terriglobus albidus]QEE30204.1 hypothetical protein FTW19_20825 [Terriglobus albidus]